MWEGTARWSTQLGRGCWVATGLSRWMGCSDPQGPARGRESINPAKMKLCPGCHNPFASSKLYKLFAVFFAFGWWLIWYSWDPIGTLGNDVINVGMAPWMNLFLFDGTCLYCAVTNKHKAYPTRDMLHWIGWQIWINRHETMTFIVPVANYLFFEII